MARDDSMSGQTLTVPCPALQLLSLSRAPIPEQIKTSGDDADRRYLGFFIAHYRNEHTRRAYLRNCKAFLIWCDQVGLDELTDIQPLHVATYIERLGRRLAPSSVKQHRACLSQLFAWMLVGSDGTINPVTPVAGPRV